MTSMSKYAPGQFSWVDLMSPDAAASKLFYGELFGWTAVDNPDDQGGTYTLFHQGEAAVAGLGEMTAEMKATGIPAFWNSYVTVQSVEASAARAAELGGSIQMPAMAVMDAGKMAILVDPTGAHFSLWEPGEHIGAGIVNEPVSLSWNELSTRDPEAAATFYSALFGWAIQTDESGDGVYRLIENQGRMNGGILELGDDRPGVPPHWMAYFAVQDSDVIAGRVEALGGQVIVPGVDIAQGRFAVLADPHGGIFTAMRNDNPD